MSEEEPKGEETGGNREQPSADSLRYHQELGGDGRPKRTWMTFSMEVMFGLIAWAAGVVVCWCVVAKFDPEPSRFWELIHFTCLFELGIAAVATFYLKWRGFFAGMLLGVVLTPLIFFTICAIALSGSSFK